MQSKTHSHQGFYQQLFELSTDAHLIIENNLFVDCNEATAKMLGYSDKTEFLQKHPSELSPEFQSDGRESAKKADEMMAIAREKGSHRFYWDHIRANGEVFPVEVLLTVLVSRKGEEALHTVWRDISDRRRNEQDLRASEAKFRSYVESAPLGIFISDLKGKFVDVNSAAEKLTGLSARELKSQYLRDMSGPENAEVVKQHLSRVFMEHRGVDDMVYVHPDGTRHIWTVSSVKHGDDRFISYVIDTTERHRMVELQQNLKDLANELVSTLSPAKMAKIAAKYLRVYFHSHAIGIWYSDEDSQMGRTLYIEDTVMGEQVPREFPPEDFPYNAENKPIGEGKTEAYLKNRTLEELGTTDLVNPVGAVERISASIIYGPMLWEEQRIGVITVHSYTLNFYSEDQLNDLQLFSTLIGSALQRAFVYERLNESLAEKEILLKELQHRTRNNMNVIISLLNMQAHESGNEHLVDEFKVIETRIFAMSTAYNKLQLGNSLNIIDLKSYLMTLANSQYHSARLATHPVKLDLDLEEINIHLEQAVPIGLAFNEMIGNACRHGFPKKQQGTISVILKRLPDDQIQLVVADDGIGVQGEGFENSKSGMGLRIIKMLVVDQLNGSHTFNTQGGCEHEVIFNMQSMRKEQKDS